MPNSDFFWAIVALSLVYSAYVAEVYRAGIQSIHPSQIAAARSLGLRRGQALRHVVLPQAVRRVIPPLLNDFIGLQKDSALVAVLGVTEGLRQAQIIQASNFNFTPYMALALIYIVITIPQARFVDWLIARDQRRRATGGDRSRTGRRRRHRERGVARRSRATWVGVVGPPGAWRELGAPARRGSASSGHRERGVTEAIRIEGLQKSFGELNVLRGIDLAMDEHEVVCLIGASGSGKSTLLRCVNLLEPVDGGRILIEGDEITAPDVDVNAIRRRIGIVFQSFNLFPHMTVLRNLTLGPTKVLGSSREQAETQARALLDRFGLADKSHEYPDRLSGGQQQRVAITRALAMNPDVLLLDEITSALDPELIAEVLDVIRDLAAAGMTMLIATHEMGFARDVASRVCFLDDGRILEEGPPSEMFSNPSEERTRRFLDRIIAAGRM